MPAIVRHTYLVLEDVRRERDRQEQLRRQGQFPYTCAAPGVPDVAKLPVLGEEYGEVCQVLCETAVAQDAHDTAYVMQDTPALVLQEAKLQALRAHLRTELVQLAAVAVAWAEALTDA